jgi:hypothetical protein
MHTGFKKFLMNLLILAITLLPFRMAYSMPIDGSGASSGQHCKDMTVVSMSQNGQTQSLDTQLSDVLSVDTAINPASQEDCCDMSDSDCTGCVHITAVYFDFLQFSDPSDNKMFSETLLSFITRVISPPSRPPLILHI